MPHEVRRLIPAMGERGYRGGSYVATDGWVDPPRNVRAYGLAMQRAGVELREGVTFLGLRTRAGRGGRRVVTGVHTSAGTIATGTVILTGGPAMQAVARAAEARAWVGYARHQVIVTEPSPALHADTTAMAFDIGAGIYWRPEEGGFLWGMSNPAEEPGPGRAIDWTYLRKMERRLNTLLPATKGLGMKKVWSATIEYTPDHLPLLGPLVRRDGAEVSGVTIASACGHGMMWGPAVSKIATDLALTGTHDAWSSAPTTCAWIDSTRAATRRSSTRSRCPSRCASTTDAYSWSTGQVSVRVMPSRSCIGITVPLASRSRSAASARATMS